MSGVTRRTTFELLRADDPNIPVPVVLRWRADDPYTISMALEQGRSHWASHGRWVTWMLSRDLLADGLHRAPAGLGDVSFLPDFDHPEHLELVLAPPSGRIGFRVPRRPLREFLRRTWQQIPAGAEVLPDSWLRAVA